MEVSKGRFSGVVSVTKLFCVLKDEEVFHLDVEFISRDVKTFLGSYQEKARFGASGGGIIPSFDTLTIIKDVG